MSELVERLMKEATFWDGSRTHSGERVTDLLREAATALAARLPDREGCPLRTAVETVLSTFRKDLEQGYRTKDKEFAIDILSMGLKLADDEQEVK
jgi:hypothetical protein